MRLSKILLSCCMLGLCLVPGGALADGKKITFGYLVADQLHEPAPMIMKNLKLLEKRGYELKWQEFLSGANLVQHMASGEVDYGTGGAAPVLTFRGLGLDFVMLASSNTNGSALIVSKNIRSPKDLDGKNIGTPGIGSMQDALVDKVAADHGIKVRKRNMKVSDMPLFLQKGEIDAFVAWEPHVSRAEGLGYGHVLLTSQDVLPNHQCCVLVSREQTVKADPKMAADVLDVYLEAMVWFDQNREEAKQMISRATGIKVEDVAKAMERVTYPAPPYLDEASMIMLVEGLVSSKKIKKENVPDSTAFVKNMILRDMLEKHLKK